MTLADLFSPEGIIIIVLVVVVLFFGGTKLPKLARGAGSSINEFKRGMSEGDVETPPTDTPT